VSQVVYDAWEQVAKGIDLKEKGFSCFCVKENVYTGHMRPRKASKSL
jgi:hypothetical protein